MSFESMWATEGGKRTRTTSKSAFLYSILRLSRIRHVSFASNCVGCSERTSVAHLGRRLPARKGAEGELGRRKAWRRVLRILRRRRRRLLAARERSGAFVLVVVRLVKQVCSSRVSSCCCSPASRRHGGRAKERENKGKKKDESEKNGSSSSSLSSQSSRKRRESLFFFLERAPNNCARYLSLILWLRYHHS